MLAQRSCTFEQRATPPHNLTNPYGSTEHSTTLPLAPGTPESHTWQKEGALWLTNACSSMLVVHMGLPRANITTGITRGTRGSLRDRKPLSALCWRGRRLASALAHILVVHVPQELDLPQCPLRIDPIVKRVGNLLDGHLLLSFTVYRGADNSAPKQQVAQQERRLAWLWGAKTHKATLPLSRCHCKVHWH